MSISINPGLIRSSLSRHERLALRLEELENSLPSDASPEAREEAQARQWAHWKLGQALRWAASQFRHPPVDGRDLFEAWAERRSDLHSEYSEYQLVREGLRASAVKAAQWVKLGGDKIVFAREEAPGENPEGDGVSEEYCRADQALEKLFEKKI